MNKAVFDDKQLSYEEWVEDINFLKNRILKKHPNPFLRIPLETFHRKIRNMKQNILKSNDQEMERAIGEFVASIGDMHTTTIGINENFNFPFTLGRFGDGFRVIETSKEFAHILGCRVTYINKIEIDEVFEEIQKIVPYENSIYKETVSTVYLSSPEILRIIGVEEVFNGISLSFIDINQMESQVDLKPMMKNGIEVRLKDRLKNNPRYDEEGIEPAYWLKCVEKEKLLYIKYRACMDKAYALRIGMRNSREYPDYYDFIEQVFNEIEKNKAEKFVFDLRGNIGGKAKYAKYLFLKLLESNKWTSKLNQKGRFFVLINEEVVSAGVEVCKYLKKNTKAIFIGAPTGGNARIFGVLPEDDCYLPNSKIYLRCSSVDDGGEVLEFEENFKPDIVIDQTFEGFLDERDQLIDYVYRCIIPE